MQMVIYSLQQLLQKLALEQRARNMERQPLLKAIC